MATIDEVTLQIEELNIEKTVGKTDENYVSKNVEEVDKKAMVTNWMSDTDFTDTSSEIGSLACSSSVVDSEDYMSTALTNKPSVSDIIASSQSPSTSDISVFNEINALKHVFNTNNSIKSLGNVTMEKCKDVIVGNVTYVTGPIHITQTNGGDIGVMKQVNIRPPPPRRQSQNQQPEGTHNFKSTPLGEEDEEGEEVNRSDLFIGGNIPRNIDGSVLRMIDRRTWLAQKPLEEPQYIDNPVSYIIISHTATELTTTQADSVYIVRFVQCFHIESRHWNDISYNFLIGGCGNVFEGRGWGVVGAHTKGYNNRSLGISFVGCFMKELPPQISLDACKLLIKKGIELGYISPDYKLVAHCQCSATESPGKMLFEHLKTWPHFVDVP